MAARQKILGLPIGRRRKSPIPKVVAAGGGALALAVPALARLKQAADPRERGGKKPEAGSGRGGDGTKPAKKSTGRDRPERTRSRNEEKGGSRERSSGEGRGDRDGGGGGQKRGKTAKSTNIIESIDVGVPVRTAYDAWTRFTEFPSFMKKVEDVEQESDEAVRWTARILWSDRTWRSHILEQVPDERIIWRSEGNKGSVDGTVTFHELAPDLTKILLVLEYHPQGGFEHIGNLWRAQGRRARLELKNFQRHVMTEVALRSEDPEGWRGEIHDGSVAEAEESDEPDEKDEASAEDEAPAENEAQAEDEPESADEEDGHDGEEEDGEEEDGQDSEPEASDEPPSQPIRRRRNTSNGDDGGPAQESQRGRGGRVIGDGSGRRVGARQTSEGGRR